MKPENSRPELLLKDGAHPDLMPAGVRVGTVDKFQGQQAEGVIVSMATSGPCLIPPDRN